MDMGLRPITESILDAFRAESYFPCMSAREENLPETAESGPEKALPAKKPGLGTLDGPASVASRKTRGGKRFVAVNSVADKALETGEERTEGLSDDPEIGATLDEGEIGEAPSEGLGVAGKVPKRKKKGIPGFGEALRRIVAWRIPGFAALGLVVLVVLVAAGPIFRWGEWTERRRFEDLAAREAPRIPPDISALIDEALQKLRDHDASGALAILAALEEEKGYFPSMSYLVALAAVQSGDVKLAEAKIAESVAKKERTSDALALQAVVESMKPADPTRAVMGDPKVRSENYLRQAISADPANAAPRFELATLLRYAQRRDEARQEIRAAQARLNPVDAHTVTEVTLALMDVEDLSDDQLPAAIDHPKSLDSALVGAYIALRRNDMPSAVRLLSVAREMTHPDIFYYLTSDPVFRRYRDRPELAEFL
jgi:thioredoxin-like negative regulator of GroEL